MMRHMHDCANSKRPLGLPYEMLLTRICKHYNVDLEGEMGEERKIILDGKLVKDISSPPKRSNIRPTLRMRKERRL